MKFTLHTLHSSGQNVILEVNVNNNTHVFTVEFYTSYHVHSGLSAIEKIIIVMVNSLGWFDYQYI